MTTQVNTLLGNSAVK